MRILSKQALVIGLLLTAAILPALCQSDTTEDIELHDDIKTEANNLQKEVDTEKATFDKLSPEEKQQYIEF